MLGGLDLQENKDVNEEELMNEIMKILGESEELLEEELIVDMGEVKDGTFRTDEATLKYYEDMQKAKQYAEAKAEEKEKENEGLKETLKKI